MVLFVQVTAHRVLRQAQIPSCLAPLSSRIVTILMVCSDFGVDFVWLVIIILQICCCIIEVRFSLIRSIKSVLSLVKL